MLAGPITRVLSMFNSLNFIYQRTKSLCYVIHYDKGMEKVRAYFVSHSLKSVSISDGAADAISCLGPYSKESVILSA